MYIESDREVADVISAPTEHSWSDCMGRAIVLPVQYNPISEPPAHAVWSAVSIGADMTSRVALYTFLYGVIRPKAAPDISSEIYFPSLSTDVADAGPQGAWGKKL